MEAKMAPKRPEIVFSSSLGFLSLNGGTLGHPLLRIDARLSPAQVGTAKTAFRQSPLN